MTEAEGGETRKARPFAFVASTLHGRQVKRLRLRLAALRPETEPFFWVAEVHAPELSDKEAKKTPLDIVDACLDAIDAAERVILLTGPTLGSAVKIGDRALASSYTELELFYAVTTGKPVHVFRLDGERADGAIERMLDALGGAAPVVSGSESALLDAARRLAANGRRGRTKADRSAALNAALAEARHRDFAGLPLFREMEFLGGRALEIDGGSAAIWISRGTVSTTSPARPARSGG